MGRILHEVVNKDEGRIVVVMLPALPARAKLRTARYRTKPVSNAAAGNQMSSNGASVMDVTPSIVGTT